MKLNHTPTLTALALTGLIATNPALAGEDDGAPHIAVADTGTELELEFEIEAGLDLTGQVPSITLIAPIFSTTFAGYVTEPLNETPTPNDDLGFVSEFEGPEGGVFSGDIIVRMLSKDANFATEFSGGLIFTDGAPDLALGTGFDTHPRWILANAEGDLTSASASFEVLDISTGSEVSLGEFDVTLVVPEPTSGLALLFGAGLIAARRRRRA
ncbi:MAG: PEP-CTERM sorting domain-containing protein [Phycisphaeraceae bacterium]